MFRKGIAVLLLLFIGLAACACSKSDNLIRAYNRGKDTVALIRLCAGADNLDISQKREYMLEALSRTDFDEAYATCKLDLPDGLSEKESAYVRAYFAAEYVCTFTDANELSGAYETVYTKYMSAKEGSTELYTMFRLAWCDYLIEVCDTLSVGVKDALFAAVEKMCPTLPEPSPKNTEEYRVVVLYYDIITGTYAALGDNEKYAERTAELSTLSTEWVRALYGD